ncbi:DUF6185 family protein [Streptomyces sp. NPDC051133]|uniref:DUF6185 family protein n=1 Tax=Streptomyces sp. NPDC051133 TaxID=3155521 RepID=UPI00343D5DCB
MAMTRWWRLLSLLALAVCVWGCGQAQARQRDSSGECLSDGLKDSTVDATLRLEQRQRSVPRITSDMTVRVPRRWPLAKQLTFGERSEQYQKAMRCLLLGDEAPRSRNEWHPHEPTVTATDSSVEVHYVAYNWITTDKPVLVGPWEIIPTGKTWMIYLWPPTLQTIRWHQIEADLGGLGFNDLVERASSSTEDHLVWKNRLPEEVQLEVDPPWQRRVQVKLNRSLWTTAGIASWWVCASILIAVAALRARHAEAAADVDAGHESSITRTLLEWAGLSMGVALALLLLISQEHASPRSHALLCIPAGLGLVLAARPWNLGASTTASDEPVRPGGIQRRQARAVIATTCAVACSGLLVVLAHDAFGLPKSLGPNTTTPFGRTGLVLLGLATVWLWLAAMVAWAWRFAREGGLLRKRWTRQWDTVPAQCVAIVACLLAAVAGTLLAWAWWANKQQWKRVNWLVEQPDPADYNRNTSNLLENFPFTDLTWLFAYSWVLTGIALLALLHFRNRPPRAHGRRRYERSPLGPSRPDLLLAVSVFTFFVGLRAAKFAGASALYGVWMILNIGALYAVIAMGRRWSVLSRMGERFCTVRLGTEQHRSELLKKAHEYRNANHQMQLLDKGSAHGTSCEQLEEKLHQLRQWLVTACEGGEPPEAISVLDIALAWGPEGRWWSNAVRAARLAFWFGTPATALLLYYQTHGSYDQRQIQFSPIGFPEFIADLVLYQMAWTAAGFTLGTLWRLLPGRRSQVRAWLLTAAYGVPVVLAAALIHVIDADPRQLLLYTALLLVVLTLTSIWMDMATFREELQYWPSRFALLLSVYQLRGLSGQITWVLAQVAVVVTIFYNLTR